MRLEKNGSGEVAINDMSWERHTNSNVSYHQNMDGYMDRYHALPKTPTLMECQDTGFCDCLGRLVTYSN